MRWLLALLLSSACAAQTVSWTGVAIAPEGQSSRESSIDGELLGTELHERARIILDRSFESSGFEGVPFSIETGSDRVVVLRSVQATLMIAFVVDTFVPYFFLDTTIPGVSQPVRYTLVCVGGKGRAQLQPDGSGDLAITVACRTYLDGSERDESEIHLSGAFRGTVK